MSPRARRATRALLLCLALAACGESPSGPPSERYLAAFDAYWETFDRTYSYFELKRIDWRAARERYRPLAAEARSQEELVEVLREMAGPLRDLHVYFRAPDGPPRPTYAPRHEVNWNRNVWLQYASTAGWRDEDNNWGYARFGAVPYIAIGAWNPAQFRIEDFDRILELFRDAPGMIVDVRMNGGGDDRLALQVAGRFTREPRVAEYTQVRNGPLHSDFTPLVPRLLEPRGSWHFERPVLLLIGRGVYSSNETFVSAMREIPHVLLMGDTTGGSSGNPAFFDLGEGWSYSVPRWVAYTADRQPIEWRGIAPDLYVRSNPDTFARGIDPVLNAAVRWMAENLPAPAPHQGSVP